MGPRYAGLSRNLAARGLVDRIQRTALDTRTLGHFISAARWTGADDALESRNPSNTDAVVARFPNGGAAEVDRAVAAASEAFPRVGAASSEVRADVLDKVAATIFARANKLSASSLAREEGKTRAEGKDRETLRAARSSRYFLGEALRRHGRYWNR